MEKDERDHARKLLHFMEKFFNLNDDDGSFMDGYIIRNQA